MIIDSDSVGDPARFQTLEALTSGLSALPSGPRHSGWIASVVVRWDRGRRQTPDRVRLTREAGVEGDAWVRQEKRNPDGQIAIMQVDVAKLIANSQPLTLFGDNLFLSLDLSASNLPPGSRLRVGTALLEVTAKPHNGCAKFRSRFGDAALKFVSRSDLRSRNLRGIYMRVVDEGETGPDDLVEVIARPISDGSAQTTVKPTAAADPQVLTPACRS